MKKSLILIAVLAILAVVSFGQVVYTYSATDSVYYGGELLEQGDSYYAENFIFDDRFTYVSGSPDSIFMSSTAVSTTAAATTTVDVTELADVTVAVDFSSGALTLYFNSTDGVGIPITEDWSMDLNTKYFNKVLIKNTATTTSYTLNIIRKF